MRKNIVSESFIDLEKMYNRVNREALWEVLKMYDIGGKLLNGIKRMYINSSASVRVKRSENELFKIVGYNRVASCPFGFSMYIWIQ